MNKIDDHIAGIIKDNIDVDGIAEKIIDEIDDYDYIKKLEKHNDHLQTLYQEHQAKIYELNKELNRYKEIIEQFKRALP
jgi:predicted RNase H-like nuclease (RuvC/YqgF family)